MGSKLFYILIGLIAIGFVIFTVTQKEPQTERPGVAHADQGREHVNDKEYGGDEPPTSGEHAEALPWRVYDEEIKDVNAIHNLEHGGIYVSYNPSLDSEEVSKLKALFFEPFSRDGFEPNKVIMAPRAANESPIVVSSWQRSLKLDSFDEEVLADYYLRNVGKSPEPLAS